jgi:hypothetical protein
MTLITFFTEDGKIGVKNDGIYSNNTFKELCGYAITPDPNVPGSLLVIFPTSKFFVIYCHIQRAVTDIGFLF